MNIVELNKNEVSFVSGSGPIGSFIGAYVGSSVVLAMVMRNLGSGVVASILIGAGIAPFAICTVSAAAIFTSLAADHMNNKHNKHR
jgi:hypothetical protein